MVIISSRLHAVRRPYLTSTKEIVAASAHKQAIIESRGQSRPVAIASLTACAKTRSASNLASSVTQGTVSSRSLIVGLSIG